MVDKTNERQEDGLSGGCFDNGRFAHAGCVKINVGSLFRRLGFNIEIQQFDNISDQVRELSERRISKRQG